MPDKKINLIEMCYTSEWALAKFFPALFKDGMDKYYNLVGISGTDSLNDVPARILREIANRNLSMQAGKNWRAKNTRTEIRSLLDILEVLDKTKYYQSRDGDLEKIENGFDAAAIFSRNTTHLDYIAELMKRNKHILCEKPLVTLTDENHLANSSKLEELERLISANPNLVLMDSEHYSWKKASITFFERVGELISKYGPISKIEGTTREQDDPEKERTRKLLCTSNRTGIALDMGVHLFGIISNIDGEIKEIREAKYDIYPGHQSCLPYDVETFASINLEIEGNLFHRGAVGKFEFVKFIHKLKTPENKDKKEVAVTFRNKQDIETKAVIDFSKGTLTDSNGIQWKAYSSPEDNEYVNILREFYSAIETGIQPRTSFIRTAKNLRAIHQAYEKFPVHKNITEVYAR